MTTSESIGYTGTDCLEVMASAVNYNRYLIELVERPAKRGDRVVDLGAGVGTFAKRLAADGYAVTCVEPDARQCAAIAAAGLPAHRDPKDIEDGSVDYLYSLNVLEHIEHDVDALVEWTRKLRPGGAMLIYVPAFQVLFSSMDRKVGHFRRYRRRELVGKMERAGLAVRNSSYADSGGFFASLVFKWFGNDDGRIDEKALVAYDRWAFPVSRALDTVLGRWLGKNAWAYAVRTEA